MRGIVRARWTVAASLAVAALAAPAGAAGPEQVEQLEPEGGEWQAEAALLSARGAGSTPSFQILRGVSDRVALGVEIEREEGTIASVAPTLLYRFSDPASGLGVGVVAQVDLGAGLTPVGGETRLIVERKAPRWWGQANAIVDLERENKATAATLAYSWRVSRAVGPSLWLGAEGSGQALRLAGPAEERGHYVGPALTLVEELRSGAEVEVNASFLRRFAGEGPRGALQLSLQVGF